MSAEILRQAAALMRERAETATPSPWGVGNRVHIGSNVVQTGRGSFTYDWMIAEVEDDDYRDFGGPYREGDPMPPVPGRAEDDAKHIASWHPAVALAVADWLEASATKADAVESAGLTFGGFEGTPALAVARAYLGGDQ